MEDRWNSVDEIAEYLGIKGDTVYKWIAEKKIPAHRVGRLWKFRKDEIDEWIKSSRAGDNRLDTGRKAQEIAGPLYPLSGPANANWLSLRRSDAIFSRPSASSPQ